MFRNSIKEVGEPSLEATSLPRRDSLSRLHDAIKNSSADRRVSCRTQLESIHSSYSSLSLSFYLFIYSFLPPNHQTTLLESIS